MNTQNTSLRGKFRKLFKNKRGASMVEYAVLLIGILVIAAAAYKAIGPKVRDGAKAAENQLT